MARTPRPSAANPTSSGPWTRVAIALALVAGFGTVLGTAGVARAEGPGPPPETSPQPAPPPPPPPALDPERPFVLEPDAAPLIVGRLGIDREGAPLADGLVVATVSAGPADVAFTLTDARGGPPVVLYATHPDNGPAVPDARTLYEDPDIRLYAAASDADRLGAAARDVGPRLGALPWNEQGPGDGGTTWRDRLLDALSLVLWGLLAFALALLVRELRAVARELGGLRAPWWALLLLTGTAFAFRAAFGELGPSNFVDIQRIDAEALFAKDAGEFLLLPLLAEILRGLSPDPVAVAGALDCVISACLPALLVVLGVLWGRNRVEGARLGWIAGVILATAPIQLRFAATTTASIVAAALLLLAVLATEVWARRATAAAALAAGLFWAVAFHARPELPAWLIVLVVWAALDGRLRRALRRFPAAAAFVLPVLAALALDAALSARGTGIRPTLLPTTAEYWDAFPVAFWRYFLEPDWHNPVISALVVLGVVVTPGRARWLLILLALALPVLLALLSGGAGGYPALRVSNLRYVLHGHVFAALLAAWAIVRVWPPPGSGLLRFLRRVTVVSLLCAAAAAPFGAGPFLSAPWPLTQEHRFLAEQGGRVPRCAALTVMGSENLGMVVAQQVGQRIEVAARRANGGALPRGLLRRVVPLGGLADAPVPAHCPRFYVRGWYEYIAPGMPDADVAAFRHALEESWSLEPLACETRPALPSAGHEDGRMELCLFRLQAR